MVLRRERKRCNSREKSCSSDLRKREVVVVAEVGPRSGGRGDRGGGENLMVVVTRKSCCCEVTKKKLLQ